LLIISLYISFPSFAISNTNSLNLKDEFFFDGTILSYHYYPMKINETYFIPLQALLNFLNTETIIDNSTKYISIKKDSLDFKIRVGSTQAFINDMPYKLSEPIVSIKNIIYVPLDFAIGATSDSVTWNLDEDTAFLEPSNSYKVSDKNIFSTNISINASLVPLSSLKYSENLLLVNKWNPLASNYIPTNLKSVLDKNNKLIVPSKLNYMEINSEALTSLVRMLKAAKIEGYTDFVVSSGYRSMSSQTYFYKNKINYFSKTLSLKDAQIKAATIVAPPGMSEHHTGLAIDITTKELLRTVDHLSQAFSNTPQGKWLSNNSWRYGYVIRYQHDKTKYTGIISEPWHLRYVGLPHSEIMKKNNMCQEEYLEYIKNTKYIKFKTASKKTYEIFYFNLLPPVNNLKLLTNGNLFCDISRYGKYGYILTKVSK
jgi:LAS superfamily LD-carboxypeptidase LdcB